MTFSEFLETANPDHIFATLMVGAILIPLYFLATGFILHVIGLIAYKIKNNSVRRFGHRLMTMVGFWSPRKIEYRCPRECKDCEFCDIKQCAGHIAAHSLWRYRREDEWTYRGLSTKLSRKENEE